MKQDQSASTSLALKALAVEIAAVRVPGRRARLPEDLKVRACRLRDEGLSTREVCHATGICSASLENWMKRFARPQEKRAFKILHVAPQLTSPASQQLVTFRYADGKITADVPAGLLSLDLIRMMTSC